MRVPGWAGDVVQLFYISCTNAEREHGRARILQEISGGSGIAAVAEAVGYQKHHFVRRFATFLKDRLKIKICEQLVVSEFERFFSISFQ